MTTARDRWDDPFIALEVEAERHEPWLRRLIEWHHSDSRGKWLFERAVLIFLIATLTFFFGIIGTITAIYAFIVRDFAMSLLIEVCVTLILRKTPLHKLQPEE